MYIMRGCTIRSPTENVLVASSWDGRIVGWQVDGNGATRDKTIAKHEGGALCATFSADGRKVFSGGCDTFAIMSDFSGKIQKIGKHDKPIKSIQFCAQYNLVATGSWDRKLKYWDCRQQQAALSIDLQERCYDMDVLDNLLVVAMPPKTVAVYDLANPKQPYKTGDSTLKNQIRCIKCFPDKNGYAAGSVCGRVAITYLAQRDEKKNFMFKCHRQKESQNSHRVDVCKNRIVSFQLSPAAEYLWVGLCSECDRIPSEKNFRYGRQRWTICVLG